MELFTSAAVWAALGNIILVNIVLSGDNAVVIAMAARGLQGRQQKLAIIWGSAAAVAMRVVLTLFAIELLTYPYLKIVGALLGYLAGDMLVTDPAITDWVPAQFPHHDLQIVPGSLALSLPGLVGAGLVILGGKWFSTRTAAKSAAGATGD